MEEINSKIKQGIQNSQNNGILELVEFYKEFIEYANFAFIIFNQDNKILYFNSTAANFFSIDHVALKALTKNNLFAQVGNLPIGEELLIQNLNDSEYFENKAIHILKKDNNRIWVNLCLKPIKNKNDNLIGKILTGFDISTQIQSDQILQNSEERFRSIFNSNNSCIAVYETKDYGNSFLIKDFNKKAEKIENLKKSDIVGRNILEIFPGVEDFGLIQVFRRVWKTGIPESHPISFYKDNRIQRWRENYVYKLETDEIVAVYNDITEMKNQEEILKESEEKFRIINSKVMDSIVQLDHEGNIIYWNDAAKRVFGYEFNEIKGKNLFKLITTETDNNTFISFFNGSKGDKNTTNIGKNIELTGKKKDGSELPIEISFSSVKFKEMWYSICIIRDVSERKDYENHLKQVLNFEKLLTSISSNFLSTIDFQKSINDTLRNIGISKMVSRVFLFSFDENEEYMMNTHEWCADGVEPHIDLFKKALLNEDPSVKKKILSGKFISIENSLETSIDSPNLRKILASRGIHATLIYHIYTNGKISGILGFNDEKRPRVWTPEDYSLLKVVSQIIGNALEGKIAEDIIKESEEKYRLISEDSDDLIMVYNEKLEIEYVNGETHERILGYSAHLFWDQKFLFSIVHQDDFKNLSLSIREGYKKGSYKLQIRYKHEKGHYIWFEIREKTYHDNMGSKKSLTVGRDITDIKVIQDQLQESEEKFRNITEQNLMGIGILQDNTLKYINKAMADLYGYSVEEMLSWKSMEMFKIVAPDTLEIAREQALKKQAGDPTQLVHYIVHGVKKTGELVWVDNVSRSITYEGRPADLVSQIDITKKMEAEQKLKESSKFPTENPNPVLRVSKEFVLFTNQAGKELFQAKVGNEIPLELENYVGMAFNENKNVTSEIQLNGHFYSIFVTPIEGTEYANIYGMDITERTIAEQKLKESEEKYRYFFNNAQVGLFWLGISDGKFLECNETFAKLVGYDTREECLADYVSLEHYVDLTMRDKMFNEIRIKNEIKDFEILVTKRDGTPYWASISARVDLKENRIEGAAIDITERKQAERELKKSEIKYRHLFETSLYFIGLVNSEGILIDCNNAIKNIDFMQNITGKSIKEIFSLNEKNKPNITLFEKAIKSVFEGVIQEGFDFRLYRTEGDYLWIHVDFSLIEIENQKSIQFIMQDITERKHSEQLLQESIEELARINTELEQFTYVASHDLKEPLRMISSFAQLLEKRYKDKLDEDANEFISFITDGAVRMQDLINNLLDFSKIGKLVRVFEAVDLNDVLKDVIDNLRQIINETKAEIIFDSLPRVFADRHELLQVFQNLISNSIKFRDIDPPLIIISAKPAGNHWIFSIRDNGIGINPKDFERIFIIFQRLNKTERYEGTGLGLAICKKIIERQGGKIWVESEVGRGSTFYFTMPREIDIIN